MARLKRLHRLRRRATIGDLKTKVGIQNREQVVPAKGAYNATFNFEDHTTAIPLVWAKVETVSGKTYFDGVATERRITHEVTIRWVAGISAQNWVILPDGQRLEVVDDENLEERNEFIVLSCDASGEGAKAASGQ